MWKSLWYWHLLVSYFLFSLGNVTCGKSSGSNIVEWAHAFVDRFAVLFDLWTCETALLEKKCQVQVFFLVWKQWLAISSLQVVLRLLFSSISCCEYMWMVVQVPDAQGRAAGLGWAQRAGAIGYCKLGPCPYFAIRKRNCSCQVHL